VLADRDREVGHAYGIDHMSVDRNKYAYGDDCLEYTSTINQRTKSHNILVLIHGYNNSFSDALANAVGFGQDTKFNALLIVWCWPSQALASAYYLDESTNTASIPHFERFFRRLIPTLHRGTVDFLAHSMGSHILLQLASDFGFRPAVKSVVFAAPDVGQNEFKAKETQFASGFQTLYAFADDRALMMSKWLHEFRARAGESGNALLLMNGLESIDAEAQGHSAIFADREVLRDFEKILQTHEHAGQRGLTEKTRHGYKYWKLQHSTKP